MGFFQFLVQHILIRPRTTKTLKNMQEEMKKCQQPSCKQTRNWRTPSRVNQGSINARGQLKNILILNN